MFSKKVARQRLHLLLIKGTCVVANPGPRLLRVFSMSHQCCGMTAMGCCGTWSEVAQNTLPKQAVTEVGAESGEELYSWSEADMISRDLLQGFHYQVPKST